MKTDNEIRFVLFIINDIYLDSLLCTINSFDTYMNNTEIQC